MKRTQLLFLLILTTLGFSCSEDLIDNEGVGSLKGSVRMERTNEPLENVKITTAPSTETVYSDQDGNFEILESIPIGEYSVKAEKKGYVTEFEAIEIQEYGQLVTLAIEMVTDEMLNAPPQTPELIAPQDGTTDLPKDVVLQWSSSDPDDDPLTYKVILKNNSTQTTQEFENLKTDTLSVQNLNFGVTYSWQVIVSDSINPEVYSESYQFVIRKNPEYRYHYVQKEKGNFVIRSSNLEDSYPVTQPETSSWRPHKNNIAQKLAFLQTLGGQTHLVTTALNGENRHKVSQVPLNGFRDDELDFAWHTDGSRFVYPSFQKLYQVNADGTGQHLLYETDDGSLITKVAWSYDGTKIAIVTHNKSGYDGKIRILDSKGNFIETIFEGEPGAVGGIDWNITGDQLLYTYDVSGYQSDQYRQLDSRIFLYDFKERRATDLSETSQKPKGTNDYDPRFSPNDAQVIFSNTANDQLSEEAVYILDLDSDGGGSRELLFENARMPDYK